MRNILTVLTLCVLTLTTSNVFADVYDESKRTERFGLSFYDGAPMYLIYFSRPGGPQQSSYPNGATTMRVERLRSDQRLEDMSGYQQGYGFVWIGSKVGGTSNGICYGFDDDGSLEELEAIDDLATSRWLQTLLREQGPGQLVLASTGDVGISVFDSVAERVKTWVLAGLIFAGSFLCAKFGFREMLRFAGTGLGGKSGAASLTSGSYDVSDDREAKKAERENFEAFKRSWDAIRELGAADAYATGEAYGLTFTAKVVKSNQILQESWSRLSEDERQFLTNEARALAWQDDLIDEKERIYRRVVMETSLLELDGVDSSEVFSNPYGDGTSDEDDDPEPVPLPGAAPLPYVALEEDEDDGLTFPGEAPSVPNRPYRETYDDYDAANRALDESYYDDEGGYW